MAGTFNVMDLEQFIREYMKEYIKKSQPDMDISENSAFDDIFIKPMVSIMKPLIPLITNTELKSSLKFAPYLTDEEIEDIGVNNYAVYRDTGATATTLQTFGFSRVPERGITIPQGVIVSTSSGLMFTTTYSTTYSKTEMQKSFNAATQTYDVTCFVTANGLGSTYNVGENMINICQTTFSEYLVYTTNKNAVTNGSDNEDTDSYISKCLTYYVNQHLGTKPGYTRDLMQKAKQLTDIKVIGYKDKGMERDVVEIVEKDIDNKTVFTDPIDGYRYAVTRSKHIGGCVDIYVRGSEYAVETLNIPINSNILCLNGPIDSSTLNITETIGTITQPIDYSIGYITDPTKEMSSYEGENPSNIEIPEGTSDDVKAKIEEEIDNICKQITFDKIFKSEKPKSNLSFLPGVYDLIESIDNASVTTIGFTPGVFGPVSVSSSAVNISNVWGSETNQKFTIEMKIFCKYEDVEYSFTKSFLAAAVKDETINTISSYDKWADTAIVFINKYYSKPSDISVSYTLLDKDAPQNIIQTYKIGYDRKAIELKSPLSESLLSIYYRDGEDDWTNKDFNDWADKLDNCKFENISNIVKASGDDEDERDLTSLIRLLRYRLSLNRIIEGDEIDDDGLNSSHDVHKFDSYYKDSSQEKIFVTLENGTDAKNFENIFQLLPNTSASSEAYGLSVQYSYNNTLHTVQTSMFEDDDRIITADVLVKEANRTPVNVAMRINIKNGAELTSTMRAQIQAAVSQLFSDAGINGRIEQSDIVGKLYSDSTTSNFVEYVRLALDAFYVPEDVNAEIVNNNEGDYIKADETSYLYLNKMTIDTLSDSSVRDTKQLKKLTQIANMPATSTISGLIIEGEHILNHSFSAAAIDEDGDIVLGDAVIISVNGDNNFSETAVKGVYDVCFEFIAEADGYAKFYANKKIEV